MFHGLVRRTVLAEADVILSGWGMAVMDEAFLAAAPKLKAVFYGAGSIRGFATDAAWERGMPRLPAMEAIKAVSSPQTNAPAPSLI